MQVKVHHRYQRHRWQIFHRCQRHRWQIAAGINDTGGKFATGINDNGGKFSLVLLIPVANLPPVSTLPAANCHRCQGYRRQIATDINDAGGKFATSVNDTGGNQWEQYQAANTLNLKAKVYIFVNSTIQRCPNKIIKIFLIEDIFHLPPVSTTPVVNLELRIFPRIFEKNRNGPQGLGGN